MQSRKGRLKSLQTSPAPAKKAQSVTEILLYLYSRGKVCWHCSKGLFYLLQSDGGSREPSARNAAPQVRWRCYICIGMGAQVPAWLHVPLATTYTRTMPALRGWPEGAGIRFPSAAHLLHPPPAHSSSLPSRTGLPGSVKLNTGLEDGAAASALTPSLYTTRS